MASYRPFMRNVTLGMRWLALATVVFFVFAHFTNTAAYLATVALVVVVAAVIVVAVVDLALRRR